MENYEILETLYSSQRSKIYKVRSLIDNNVYAVKRFLQNKNWALHEIKAHKSYQISFVASIVESFESDDDNTVIIQMEYCNQGNLRTYIQQIREHMGNLISERVVARILIQLVYLGLYMNFENCQHRAIIPENLLVTSKQQGDEIRLTDFAMAGSDSMLRQPTIPAYLPPEFLANNQFTQKSQVWQIGLVLYELTNQKPLFQINESAEFIRDMIEKGGVHIKMPGQYSKNLKQIVRICLEIKEKLRPSVKQLATTSGSNVHFFMIAFQKMMNYYQLSYEEKQNFSKWVKLTAEEMGKKKSIIMADPNFYSTFVKSSHGSSEFQQGQYLQNQPLQPLRLLKTSQSQSRPQLELETIAQQNFRAKRMSQQFLSKPPPLQKNFILRKKIDCSQYNFSLKSTFNIELNENKLQFEREENKLREQAYNNINELIKVKLQQCINEMGFEQTKTAVETLMKQDESGNEAYLKVILRDFNEQKMMLLKRHLLDVVDFLPKSKQMS